MAQVSFFFFNTGGSTGAGDATGDVFAGFNVEQSSTLGRIIGAFLGHCTNAACSTLVTDAFQTFTRSWKPGVSVPLQVIWDYTNDQFIYTAGTEQRVLGYSGVLTDAVPAMTNVRDLQVRNVLPNCTTPIRASTTARYDVLHIATEPSFP
jgi:hypothetical protein